MIIGDFRIEDGSYRGDITTLTLQRSNVVFRPTSKTGEREPDYRIVQETEVGTVELGAAWKRRSEGGREFLSVVLDDPALPTSVNAAVFMADHEETATLVWQRAAKKTATPEAKPARSRLRRAAVEAGLRPA
jgi:uncharacterized protein (DUF736 family)